MERRQSRGCFGFAKVCFTRKRKINTSLRLYLPATIQVSTARREWTRMAKRVAEERFQVLRGFDSLQNEHNEHNKRIPREGYDRVTTTRVGGMLLSRIAPRLLGQGSGYGSAQVPFVRPMIITEVGFPSLPLPCLALLSLAYCQGAISRAIGRGVPLVLRCCIQVIIVNGVNGASWVHLRA